MALSYEDLNDHQDLRHDPALQTATSRIETLASPATLCRLEHRSNRKTAIAIHEVFFRQFIRASTDRWISWRSPITRRCSASPPCAPTPDRQPICATYRGEDEQRGLLAQMLITNGYS